MSNVGIYWANQKQDFDVDSDETHFHLGGYVNKQKLPYLGFREPTCVLTEANAPITSECKVRLMDGSYYWPIYLWKWEQHNHYCQWKDTDRIMIADFFYTHSSWHWCERCLPATGYGVFFSTKKCALYFKKCNFVFVS